MIVFALQTIAECTAKGGECDEKKGSPVCGTDNQTYLTRCHLIRAKCGGYQVGLKYRGACKNECLGSRSYALVQRRNDPRKVNFVPKCRLDGSYATIQCIDSGSCWCVTAHGKTIPNTVTTHGRPYCGKKSNQRRSPQRNSSTRQKKGI